MFVQPKKERKLLFKSQGETKIDPITISDVLLH